MSESVFDSIFGKGGAFDGIFGKGGAFDAAIKDGTVKRVFGGTTQEALERDRYNEALMTELLTTLAGKKIITNDDARDLIAKARERVKKKAAEDEKPGKTQETAHGSDAPCGGTCPLHDKRPHKDLECRRCKKVERHLIEPDGTARCRVCLTARYAT